MKTNEPIWGSYESPFGKLTLTAGPRGLSGLHFPGRRPALSETAHRNEEFEQTIVQLDEFFAGTRQQFDVSLDLAGTPFQHAVWTQLQRIPYGETINYTQLAERIARPDRLRAAAAAVGRTPVPIIVPCHRVIGADGSLTGYVGGLQRKRALLDTEYAVRHGSAATIRFDTRQLALL